MSQEEVSACRRRTSLPTGLTSERLAARVRPPAPACLNSLSRDARRGPGHAPGRVYNVAMSDQPDTARTGSRGTGNNRWLFWTIGLLALAGGYLYVSRSPPSAIAWMDDLEAGLARAARDNQLVLVDFDATWCGYCRQMDRDVFSRQDVADALADWVPVKIDVDKHGATAARYAVQGPPTFIVLSPEGEVVGRLPGAVEPEVFLQWIKSVEDDRSPAAKPG